MSNVIQDPKLNGFVDSLVSNDFGLSVEQVANQCKNDGRFKHWLNSDVNRIIEVLNVVKGNGISPTFFASYEKTEGYNSSWGWLNHTRPDGSPLNDADTVSRWLESQSRSMNSNPSWYDYGNPVHFVPESVQREGNAHFKSMLRGSIGRALIPSTAAATWEVYYPLGLKKEYNKVQNYGKPITNMVIYIESWGGIISGEGSRKPAFPTERGVTMTSAYGWRTHPITGNQQFHTGTDYASGGFNVPIYAMQDGIITQSRFSDTGGWMVYIEHTGDPYHSRYLHLDAKPLVNVGDTVAHGERIGFMGTTGSSTGIHLHVEVGTSQAGLGTQEGTIDPEIYLEMGFGGDIPGDDKRNRKDNLIRLLLSGALHGW